MTAVNDVAITGTPLAYGIGFTVLALLAFSVLWARSLVTIAHEGGHVVAALLVLHNPKEMTLDEKGGGLTVFSRGNWFGRVFVWFSGYAFPPLLGLAGAVLIANGNPYAALISAFALLFGAFLFSGNSLTNWLVLIPVFGIGWLIVRGTPYQQAAAAVGVSWWLLIGGLVSSTWMNRSDGSDAERLANHTLIPRIIWHAVWFAIAVVCAWRGGRMLLGL